MINRNHFFAKYHDKYGATDNSQTDGLNFLLNKLDESKVFNLASEYTYILATVKWECANTFQPITEMGSQHYLKSKPYYPYIGNGFVMLTWEDNYRKFGKILNIDLVGNPELAKEPETAWQILEIGMSQGLYTGKKLSDYVNESITDYYNARRVINGTDKANTIKDIAESIFYMIEFI